MVSWGVATSVAGPEPSAAVSYHYVSAFRVAELRASFGSEYSAYRNRIGVD
jgi:hypothetical protein